MGKNDSPLQNLSKVYYKDIRKMERRTIPEDPLGTQALSLSTSLT